MSYDICMENLWEGFNLPLKRWHVSFLNCLVTLSVKLFDKNEPTAYSENRSQTGGCVAFVAIYHSNHTLPNLVNYFMRIMSSRRSFAVLSFNGCCCKSTELLLPFPWIESVPTRGTSCSDNGGNMFSDRFDSDEFGTPATEPKNVFMRSNKLGLLVWDVSEVGIDGRTGLPSSDVVFGSVGSNSPRKLRLSELEVASPVSLSEIFIQFVISTWNTFSRIHHTRYNTNNTTTILNNTRAI